MDKTYKRTSFCEGNIDVNPEMTITGYAAVYDSPTKINSRISEVIRKGAFSESLTSGTDIVALYNHDDSKPLGRRSRGTLKLSTDDKGLKYEVELNRSDPEHVSIYEKIKRGDILGSSFRFTIPANGERRSQTSNGLLSEIINCGLIEVSPVTFPAYANTSAQILRSIFGEDYREDDVNSDGPTKAESPVAKVEEVSLMETYRKESELYKKLI